MTNQDRLAHKIFFENKNNMLSLDDIEKMMDECNLTYRKGKTRQDLRIMIGGAHRDGAHPINNMTKLLEIGAEEIDKFLTIKNWNRCV